MSRKIAVIVLFFFKINGVVFGQSHAGTVVDSLNKYIRPLASNGDSVKDYSSVIRLLKDKSLVSLGESTHGTKEVFDGKAAIIKGLIEQGNFKALYMETDYCGLLSIDSLLHQPKGQDMFQVFKASGLYGIYKTKEVYRLFDWIRLYNQKQEVKNRVSILGIDMQSALTIADKLFQLLPDSGKNDLKIYNSLILIKKSYEKSGAIVFNKKEQIENQEMLSRLVFLSQKESDPDFTFIVRLMEQSLALINIPDYRKRSDLRDQYLAENIIWLRKNSGAKKAVMWAHNGHISNVQTAFKLPMGYYLKQELKDDYYTLAFAFNVGRVRILDARSNEKGFQERQFSSAEDVNSIEYYFKDCKPQDFFLDFKEIAGNQLFKQFFRRTNRMRTIGTRFLGDGADSFNPLPVLESFDGLVFYNKTSAAQGF